MILGYLPVHLHVVTLQPLSKITFQPDGQSVQTTKLIDSYTLEISELTFHYIVQSGPPCLWICVGRLQVSCCCGVSIDGRLSDDTDTNPIYR
jgi:hypothetical protein